MAAALALGLTACASPAVRSDRMAPQPTGDTAFHADSPWRNAIELKEVGGGPPPADDSDIDAAQLRQAIESALQQFGLVPNDPAKARFRLNVSLVRLSPPGAGIDLTVNSQLQYTLTRADTGALLFNEVVRASYTAQLGDEFVAFLRQRLAKEGSIRANISEFLQRLKALPTSGPFKQAAELLSSGTSH